MTDHLRSLEDTLADMLKKRWPKIMPQMVHLAIREGTQMAVREFLASDEMRDCIDRFAPATINIQPIKSGTFIPPDDFPPEAPAEPAKTMPITTLFRATAKL